jgi:NadR type nicotinamide-nucleotide adenylyltransferase
VGARTLVIGKFLPPHAGHHALVEAARRGASSVDVVVCDLDGQRPAATTRARWLAAIHPDARVHVVADLCGWHEPGPCQPECSPAFAHHLVEVGLGPWDRVVTSEDYGPLFAESLGARHELHDRGRRAVPVSGRAIRADISAGWSTLHPIVRAGLTRRVVVVGAESTGTTTLATALAGALGAPYVAEHGRAYTEQLAHEAGSVWDIGWTAEHFAAIADGQEQAETEALTRWVDAGQPPGPLGPWLVCDTDLLATAVWHERYLDEPAPQLVERALASEPPPALYVLTTPDGVAFEQDGLRDGEHMRDWMTQRFRSLLAEVDVAWIEVRGTPQERLDAALGAVAAMPSVLHQPEATQR